MRISRTALATIACAGIFLAACGSPTSTSKSTQSSTTSIAKVHTTTTISTTTTSPERLAVLRFSATPDSFSERGGEAIISYFVTGAVSCTMGFTLAIGDISQSNPTPESLPCSNMGATRSTYQFIPANTVNAPSVITLTLRATSKTGQTIVSPIRIAVEASMAPASNWWATVEPEVAATQSDLGSAESAWQQWEAEGANPGNDALVSTALSQLYSDGRSLDGMVIGATPSEVTAIGDLTSACYAVGIWSTDPGNVTIEEFNAVANAIAEVHTAAGSS